MSRDVYLGSGVESAINIFSQIVKDKKMDLSFYNIDCDDGTSVQFTLSELMSEKGITPILSRAADEIAISVFNQRVFTFDYVPHEESFLSVSAQDNEEEAKELIANPKKRLTNALVYQICLLAFHKVVKPVAGRQIQFDLNQVKLMEASPNADGLVCFDFMAQDQMINAKFDQFCKDQTAARDLALKDVEKTREEKLQKEKEIAPESVSKPSLRDRLQSKDNQNNVSQN